jgi:adenylate cyclase
VNLAQRLEGAAPRGGVLVSARTAALVRDQFRLTDAGALTLKGFDKEEEAKTVDLPETTGGAG